MTAKEYLQSVRWANVEADRRVSRLERYRDCAGYGTGKREATRISGTSQRSRVEDNVCALVDLERKLGMERGLMADADRAVDEYVDRKAEATALIARIPRQLYREVLYHYYIDCLSWEQVAAVVGRSLRQTHYIHGWALQIFERVIQRNTTCSTSC